MITRLLNWFRKARAERAKARSQQRVDMPLTVAEAQRLRVCRICKVNDNPATGNPLVLNYGEEYAHEQCLKRHIDESSDLRTVSVRESSQREPQVRCDDWMSAGVSNAKDK